jgi:S1-C subfamily serine protease
VRGGDEQVVVSGESYRLGGDLIVAAGGRRVTSVEQLRDVLSEHEPGDELAIEIYRDGDKRTVTVTLGRQPTSPQG